MTLRVGDCGGRPPLALLPTPPNSLKFSSGTDFSFIEILSGDTCGDRVTSFDSSGSPCRARPPDASYDSFYSPGTTSELSLGAELRTRDEAFF